jgi:hypothetical protein
MKTKIKAVAKGLLFTVLLTAGLAQAAPPAVLSQLPADADLVLVTQPLSIVSAKLDLFMRAAGITQQNQPPFKVEDMLSAQLDMPGMIDGTQSFALVIGDLQNAEQTMVAYLPVTNAIQAIEAQGAQKVPGTDDIWQLPQAGTTFKPAGKYLLVGENPDTFTALAQKNLGLTLSPSDAALLAKSEALAVIKLGSLLPELRKEALQEVNQAEELQEHPGLKKVINMSLDRLVEVEKISTGLSLGKNGIKLTALTKAQADSTLAKYLVAQPKTDAQALAKMPAGKFITAATYRIDQKTVETPVFAIFDALAEEITQTGQDCSADVKQLKSTLSRIYGDILKDAVCQAQYAPAAPSTTPGAMQLIQITSFKNVKPILDASQKLYPLMSKLIQQAGYNLPMTYKTGVGKVEGISYDEFTFDLSQLPIPPEALQAIAQQWGGKAAMTQQYCALDADRLAVGMGAGTLQEAVQLAKTSTAGLNTNPGIVQTAQNLDSQANMLVFIDVNSYLQLVMSQMMSGTPQGGMNPMMMFMPILGQIKGTVGVSATLNSGSASTEMFIPTEVIQSAYAAYMQMMMQMMMPPDAAPPTAPEQ